MLTATISPRYATNKTISWTNSHPTVASLSENGLVTALTAGTTIITVTSECGNLTATCRVEVFDISTDVVVIGEIRWATRNLAAPGYFVHKPEDVGMLYQWGTNMDFVTHYWDATTPGPAAGWDDDHSFPRIAWTAANDSCPTGWRVPIAAEFQSLINAGSTSATLRGVNGILFGTAPNQLFLPAAGSRNWLDGFLFDARRGWGGDYWSNTRAASLNFNQSFVFLSNGLSTRQAISIRCVAE